MGKIDRWFWEHVFPHLLLFLLGGFAAIVLHDPVWKAVALSAACLGVAALVVMRFAWPTIRRNFRDAKNAHTRARLTHKIAHHTRDELIKLLPPVSLSASGSTSAIRCLPSLKGKNSIEVGKLLNDGVELLRTHVDYGANVWGSIRELRADGKYYTVARVGDGFNPTREASSLPLDERTMTVQQLRNSYNLNKCVIMTGSTRGEELWTRQPNDRFGEDKSVLMGAVVVKSVTDKSPEDRLMVWIVSICSDNEHAFSNAQVPTMQAIVDHFSTLANVLAREAWLKQPEQHKKKGLSSI